MKRDSTFRQKLNFKNSKRTHQQSAGGRHHRWVVDLQRLRVLQSRHADNIGIDHLSKHQQKETAALDPRMLIKLLAETALGRKMKDGQINAPYLFWFQNFGFNMTV